MVRVSDVNRPSRCDHEVSRCPKCGAFGSRTSTVRAGAITCDACARGWQHSVSDVNRPSRCDHRITRVASLISPSSRTSTVRAGAIMREPCPSESRSPSVSDVNRPSRCDHRPGEAYPFNYRVWSRTSTVRAGAITGAAFCCVYRRWLSRTSTVRAGAITHPSDWPVPGDRVSDVNRPSRCDHTS